MMKTLVNSIYHNKNLKFMESEVGKVSKMTIRKTDRKCVLCRYWNGAMGSTTIQPKMGGIFQYEGNEKQQCFKKCVSMPSWSTCRDFEPRY